jgi:DNA-3-methyladenine glycosylase II
MSIALEESRAAVRHLRRSDPTLRHVIQHVGPFRLRLERNRFGMLVRSILSQQLSTGAARTIRGRLEGLLPPGGLTPQNLAAVSHAEMRSAGVSNQKAEFLADLADATLTGRIRLAKIGRKSDDDVIAELTQVHGIGRWTAQMFLIFSLGRLDVFPFDDLGVRAAIRNLNGLQDLPDKPTAEAVAEKWRPYASVASWYCWRSIDLRLKIPA